MDTFQYDHIADKNRENTVYDYTVNQLESPLHVYGSLAPL